MRPFLNRLISASYRAAVRSSTSITRDSSAGTSAIPRSGTAKVTRIAKDATVAAHTRPTGGLAVFTRAARIESAEQTHQDTGLYRLTGQTRGGEVVDEEHDRPGPDSLQHRRRNRQWRALRESPDHRGREQAVESEDRARGSGADRTGPSASCQSPLSSPAAKKTSMNAPRPTTRSINAPAMTMPAVSASRCSHPRWTNIAVTSRSHCALVVSGPTLAPHSTSSRSSRSPPDHRIRIWSGDKSDDDCGSEQRPTRAVTKRRVELVASWWRVRHDLACGGDARAHSRRRSYARAGCAPLH